MKKKDAGETETKKKAKWFKDKKKNMQRLGGRGRGRGGLSLEAFANAKTKSNTYNPAVIKKQREFYKNAKYVSKYKRIVKQLGETSGGARQLERTKGQFHCDDCGICRVGGRENFFHCKKCGSCYSVELRDNHLCVENSMKNHCPICYEFLFDSVKGTTIMKCGHTMHMECYTEMIHQNQYRCPICSKSVLNMAGTWQRLDLEIEATAMPEEYRYEVPILCNDCNSTGKAFFHILGHKCKRCNSYNTRMIGTGEDPQ